MLSTLFAVKAELCNTKFELKVNDVRFVGHPTLLPYKTNKDNSAAPIILINIVFALQASASHSIGMYIKYLQFCNQQLLIYSYLAWNLINR